MIARTLKKKNPRHELCRITGLDPGWFILIYNLILINLKNILAGPGFYPPIHSNFKHISARDAKLVDIIHTDVIYGTSEKTGTADFFPNGGYSQPGMFLKK